MLIMNKNFKVDVVYENKKKKHCVLIPKQKEPSFFKEFPTAKKEGGYITVGSRSGSRLQKWMELAIANYEIEQYGFSKRELAMLIAEVNNARSHSVFIKNKLQEFNR